MDAASAAIAREKPVSIDGLLELAKPDMAKVDALIRDRMQSPVSVIPALAEHLIGGLGEEAFGGRVEVDHAHLRIEGEERRPGEAVGDHGRVRNSGSMRSKGSQRPRQ